MPFGEGHNTSVPSTGCLRPAGERSDFYGRRGRPVKKPRFLPADLAHHLARRLQARGLGTVSVL